MNKLNIRAMVEGAILAAITVIMGFFYMMPVLQILTFFWPVPIIIIGYRHGFKVSIISTIVAAIIISLLVNPVIGLALLVAYGLPGAVIGMMLHRKASSYIAILIGGLLIGATALIEFAIIDYIMFGKNIFHVLLNLGTEIDFYYSNIYNSIVQTSSALKKFGIDENTIKQVLDLYKSAIDYAKIILPIALSLSGIFISFINFKVARIILSRLGYKIEDVKEFSKWRIRENLVAPMLIFTLGIIALNYMKVSWLQGINLNLITLLFGIYGVLGLSVMAYFIQKIGVKNDVPRPLLGAAAAVLFLFLYPMLPLIGMFDLTADIRRLNKNTIGGVK